jgi:hypothetical protein
MYYSIILIFLAAILNAFMDTLAHHFSTSIFKELNVKFWNPNISWEYAKKINGYVFDAWHMGKSLMIFCLMGAVVMYVPITNYKLLDWAILGVLWNTTFSLFYNKIFR